MSDDEREVQQELEEFIIRRDSTSTQHFVFDGSFEDYRAQQCEVRNIRILQNFLASMHNKVYNNSNDSEWLYPTDTSIIKNYFYASMEAYLGSYEVQTEDGIAIRNSAISFILGVCQSLDTNLNFSQLGLSENLTNFDNLH